MKNPALTLRVICFGIFEFSPQTGELRRHGLKIKLEPQASKILSLLLEYPGKICAREELQQQLWQDNHRCHVEGAWSTGFGLQHCSASPGEGPRFSEAGRKPACRCH